MSITLLDLNETIGSHSGVAIAERSNVTWTEIALRNENEFILGAVAFGGAKRRARVHTDDRRRYRWQMPARLTILFSAICFGTTGTAAALGPSEANSLAVGTSRIVIGALLLQMFAIGKSAGVSPVRLRAWLWAGAGMACYQLTFFAAVHLSGVTVGTVVALGSAPALTGAIDWLWSGTKPRGRWWIATVCAVIGVIILTSSKGSASQATSLWGILLALGAGASYAIFAVCSKEILASGASFQFAMARVFGIGAIMLAPLLFILPMEWITTPQGAGMALWLGAVPTAIAYLAYAYGLKSVQPNEAATLTLAEPVTATLFGVLLLNERSSLTTWVGVAIVALGLLLLAMQRSTNVRPGVRKGIA